MISADNGFSFSECSNDKSTCTTETDTCKNIALLTTSDTNKVSCTLSEDKKSFVFDTANNKLLTTTTIRIKAKVLNPSLYINVGKLSLSI